MSAEILAALMSRMSDQTAAGKAAIESFAQSRPLGDVPMTQRPQYQQRASMLGMGGGAGPAMGSSTPNKARLIEAARRAGFTGQALATAVAVAMAESGGRENARGVNSDSRRTVDRGPWQINSYWHREVPDAEAYNYDAAARHAFRISGGGRNWSPWTTYKTGAYRRYI